MPLGQVWAYSPLPPKSFRTILTQLLNCAGGDGNYLLSIGCKPDGSIADTDAARMREMGEWLKQYGETVYATRGGVWKPTSDYAACSKENVVYLHIFKESDQVKLELPLAKNELCGWSCMTGEAVQVAVEADKLIVEVNDKCTIDTIVKLEFAANAVMEEDEKQEARIEARVNPIANAE